jgi:hypothetical protein
MTKEEMLKIADAAITEYLNMKKSQYLQGVEKYSHEYLANNNYNLNAQFFEEDFAEWLFG